MADYNDLNYTVNLSYVTVASNNGFQVVISNFSDSPIVFNNPDKIKPDDYPDVDDAFSANSPAGFYFIFSFGDEGANITDESDCYNIQASFLHRDDWSIRPVPSHKRKIYWLLAPGETTSLGPSQSLTVQFSNISCNPKPGVTPLEIQLHADGQSYSNTLPITKLEKPAITMFKIKEADYDIGDTITLQWEATGTNGCIATINQYDATNKNEYQLQAGDTEYVLTIRNQANFAVVKTVAPSFAFIVSFGVVGGNYDTDTLRLGWKTRNCQSCEILGVGQVELAGTKEVTAVKGEAHKKFSYTLSAIQVDSGKVHQQTVSFVYPLILDFRTENRLYVPYALQSLDLDGQDPFVSLAELEDKVTCPVVTLPYDGYDPPKPPDPPTNHYVVSWSIDECDHCDISYVGSNIKALSGFREINRGLQCTLTVYSAAAEIRTSKTIQT